ncbi:MAG: N-acetylglucosamine-6-phosphate deacetylase [Alicyclobacillus sp.]|nr:N-acetylglucosamine-6-phosphate deacetylase [Alicyclobacillus sp.]
MKTVISGYLGGKPTDILCEDGLIRKVGACSAGELEGAVAIDTQGRLLPGYVDIHVHGGGGADTMDATPEAFRQICATHARHGTTGLLLTTVTAPDADIEQVLRSYREHRDTALCATAGDAFGAEILGFHIEGPYINPKRPGAQPAQYVRRPDPSALERWVQLSEGAVRLITMAPEVAGAPELIDAANRLGVVVSAGHSDASYSDACTGYGRGIRSTTHLFNAMSGLNHREPGLVGAALDTEEAYVEVIADLHHVHPAALRTAVRVKGAEKVLAITDSVQATDMPPGTYQLGGQPVYYRDGTVRLADGTLAGSALTLDVAIQNLLRIRAIQPSDVPLVSARNQARLLQLPHGELLPGRPANLIAVDPDWTVTHTVVRGQLVFRR